MSTNEYNSYAMADRATAQATQHSETSSMSPAELETYKKEHRIGPDGKARPWWKDVVCYQVWPRSFRDSGTTAQERVPSEEAQDDEQERTDQDLKGRHGDIRGVIEKLDHIQSLGVDVLWLCPVYANSHKDAGYDITDYSTIDPDFGTMADMDELIVRTKKRGMRIIIDLVVSHTSDKHAWFEESRKNKTNPKADWYIWADPKRDANGDLIVRSKTGEPIRYMEPSNWRAALIHDTAWTWCEERQQFYLHCFLKCQPDLNWETEACRKAIYATAIQFWLKKGIDGFRVDTSNRMSKDMTFTDAEVTTDFSEFQDFSKHCLNGPRIHEYIQEMRRVAMDPYGKGMHDDIMMVGELPGTKAEELLLYTIFSRQELRMTFDFDMSELGGNDHPDLVDKHEVLSPGQGFLIPEMKDCIAKTQSLISGTGGEAWTTSFAENHDQVRSIRRWVTDHPDYWSRACKLMCILECTLSGTLFVFQGQEIGMHNMPSHFGPADFRDIDAQKWCARPKYATPDGDPYMAQLAIDGVLNVGRDNTRTPMQWDDSANAGFTAHPDGPWMPLNDNYREINVAKQNTDKDSPLNFWRKMIKYRARHKELFIHGTFKCLDRDNERLFIFVKETWNGYKALVLLNFSAERLPFTFAKEALRETGEVDKWSRRVTRKPLVLIANYSLFEQEAGALQGWEARVYLM
nr:hypothetical protein B0A51_15530 [Rachicladosporium sp. CCFEE 5018]